MQDENRVTPVIGNVTNGPVPHEKDTTKCAKSTGEFKTTGTRKATTQTELDPADTAHKHGASHSKFVDAGTEMDPYTAEAEADAIYDLTDFAKETNGTSVNL